MCWVGALEHADVDDAPGIIDLVGHVCCDVAVTDVGDDSRRLSLDRMRIGSEGLAGLEGALGPDFVSVEAVDPIGNVLCSAAPIRVAGQVPRIVLWHGGERGCDVLPLFRGQVRDAQDLGGRDQGRGVRGRPHRRRPLDGGLDALIELTADR